MASATWASAGIKCLGDLSDKKALGSMLKAYYGRPDVELADDGGGGGGSDLEQFFGNNDFYNSEIRKVAIKVRIGNTCYTIASVL